MPRSLSPEGPTDSRSAFLTLMPFMLAVCRPHSAQAHQRALLTSLPLPRTPEAWLGSQDLSQCTAVPSAPFPASPSDRLSFWAVS